MKAILVFLAASMCANVLGKVNIAVLELQTYGGLSQGEAQIVTDRITSVILEMDAYTVVERQQIGAILKEQGFQASGACTDRDCMVEIGQLLSVRRVFGGSLAKVENRYMVTLKILDVQTGKIIAQEIGDFGGAKAKFISRDVPDLVRKLIAKAAGEGSGTGTEVAVSPAPSAPSKPVVASPSSANADGQAPRRSVLTRGYFWVPTGVVAAGAVVAGIVYATRRDGDTSPSGAGVTPDLPLEPYPGR